MFGWLKRLFGFGNKPVYGFFWQPRKGHGNLPQLDVPVAMVLPMVMMMHADGNESEAERELIYTLCQVSPVFQKPSRHFIKVWIEEADRIRVALDGNPKEIYRKAREALSAPLRETAFAFALLISYADYRIADAEKSKADEIAKGLEIDKSKAAKIHEVVDILRHSAFVK